MARVFNLAWGAKADPGPTITTQPVAAPTAPTNPLGLKSNVGRRAPVPISMRRAIPTPEIKQVNIKPITPSVQVPTDAAIGLSTREVAMQIERRKRGKLPRPTKLLSEPTDVRLEPLPAAEQALVDADTKTAVVSKVGIDAITSADIGDAATAGDPIAKQIKAFELIAKTRSLTLAEKEMLSQLKREFIDTISKEPAEATAAREQAAIPAQEELTEEKALEDAVVIEAQQYLRDQLAASADLDDRARAEAARLRAEQDATAKDIEKLSQEARQLELFNTVATKRARFISAEIDTLEEAKNEALAEAEEVDENEAEQLAARAAKIEAQQAELQQELEDLTAAARDKGRRATDVEYLLTETKLGMREITKRQAKVAKAYKRGIAKLTTKPPPARLAAAAKALAAGPPSGARDLELYLRKVVGPKAAYSLSRKLLTEEEGVEEAEEKEDEGEGAMEAPGAYPIDFGGYEREEEPRLEEFAGILEAKERPRQVDVPVITENEAKNLDDVQLSILERSFEDKMKEVAAPAYDEPEETRIAKLADLAKLQAVNDIVIAERKKIADSRAVNEAVAQKLKNRATAEAWVNIQIKPKNELTRADKEQWLSFEQLKNMFKLMKKDFPDEVTRSSPKFDIHGHSTRAESAKAKSAKAKSMIPNADRQNLSIYLANNIPRLYR